MRVIAASIFFGLSIVKPAAAAGANDTFTLYRTSVVDSAMRIHVATFDADDGFDYNRENCDVARDLFARQPDVRVRYWCERGRYRKGQ